MMAAFLAKGVPWPLPKGFGLSGVAKGSLASFRLGRVFWIWGRLEGRLGISRESLAARKDEIKPKSRAAPGGPLFPKLGGIDQFSDFSGLFGNFWQKSKPAGSY
jgi:hypothetical protein